MCKSSTTTKKKATRTDIYNLLTRHDFEKMDTESLEETRNQYSDAFDGIMAALRAMGCMAFWARSSDEYSDEQALEDSRAVVESLMYLPRIAEALKFNAIDADFELWCRKGLATSYKVEDAA
ncbi:hypothetical protein [Sodalis sp.]|uniref:hypothetical protein n=1 Tax=Sodalis sp. (in: enterobacteria) TaxID=1898979 RepID=UPI0038733E68